MNPVQSGIFSKIYAEAHDAGMAACFAACPEPMVVVGGVPGEEPKAWYVSEGMCGFAWVNCSPGNHPFSNWLKKNGKARKAYGGGVDIWVSEGGQSIDRKEKFARAFADVVKRYELSGLKVHPMSRLD